MAFAFFFLGLTGIFRLTGVFRLTGILFGLKGIGPQAWVSRGAQKTWACLQRLQATFFTHYWAFLVLLQVSLGSWIWSCCTWRTPRASFGPRLTHWLELLLLAEGLPFGIDGHSAALFWLTKFIVGLRGFDKLWGRTQGLQGSTHGRLFLPNLRLSPDLVLWLSFSGSARS